MTFSQYLEMKYLEWQQKQGGRKTIAEFAAYLGIAQTTASSYMNGVRKPEGEKLQRIAEKLGIEVTRATTPSAPPHSQPKLIPSKRKLMTFKIPT